MARRPAGDVAGSFAVDAISEVALILGSIDGRVRGRIDDQIGRDPVERRGNRLSLSEVEYSPRLSAPSSAPPT